MSRECVLDASVLAKCVFEEEGTAEAEAFLISAPVLLAPDFILVELASIAAKKVRRGEARREFAAEALARAPLVLTELEPAHRLAAGAFELAVQHGVSVYDGMYLRLASERNLPVLTADIRLVERVRRAGVGHLVLTLDAL